MPNCCVPGCRSNTQRASHGLSLFKLTKDEERRRQWLEVMERETGTSLDQNEFKNDARICSLHFTQSDIRVKIDEFGLPKRFLNVDAVPSVFQRLTLEDNKDEQRCRICLKRLQAVANYSIYDELASIGMSIVEALNSDFGIELVSSDSYPTHVCALCHNNILTAHTLKARISKTEESLRSLTATIERDFDSQDGRKTCTQLILKHLAKSQPDTATRQRIRKRPPERRLVFRNNKLVFATTTTTVARVERTPAMKCEAPTVKSEPGEEPAYLFDAIEMDAEHEDEVTFLLERPDSSSDVVELSSEDEREKFSPKYNEAGERVFDQWPEEVAKALAKQQKLKAKTCRKCGFAAKNLNALHKHIDASVSDCMTCYEPKVKCYICERMFMMVKSKLAHVKRDHGDAVQKECRICEQSLRETPQTYENHLRRHFESPSHLCVLCGKGFYKNEHYVHHLREVHDDTYWLECDTCGTRMKNKQSLIFHMRRHTRERPALCDICSKNLFSVMSLKKHKFCVHKVTDQSIFRCEKCDFCYLFKREFERHVIRCDGDGRHQKSQARIRFGDLVQARSVISRSGLK